MKRAAAVALVVLTPVCWYGRTPHFMLATIPGAMALLSSQVNTRRLAAVLSVGYLAVWAFSPVQAHRDFQAGVLRVPGMDCNTFHACNAESLASTQQMYGGK